MNYLPNFFLVGAVKAGTTAFHNMLSQHPEIYMAPIKEPNFFSQPDLQPNLYTDQYRRSVSFDLSRYLKGTMHQIIHIADAQSWDDYHLLFKNVRNERAIGEGSNSYLYCSGVAQRIAKALPHAKIIMILRNPIERAWSHYLMNRKLGYSVRPDFLEEIHEDTRVQPQGWGITANYFRLGLYAEQVDRFLSAFPGCQVKIFLYDDFRRAPRETLSDAFDFLDVNPTFNVDFNTQKNSAALPRWPSLQSALQRSSISHAIKRKTPSSIKTVIEKILLDPTKLPELTELDRQALASLYESDIRKLERIMSCTLDHWLV